MDNPVAPVVEALTAAGERIKKKPNRDSAAEGTESKNQGKSKYSFSANGISTNVWRFISWIEEDDEVMCSFLQTSKVSDTEIIQDTKQL